MPKEEVATPPEEWRLFHGTSATLASRIVTQGVSLKRNSARPMNSRTSGPPALANLMVRDMAVSGIDMMSSSGCFGGLSCRWRSLVSMDRHGRLRPRPPHQQLSRAAFRNSHQ